MKPDNLRKQGANSGEQSTDEDVTVPCRIRVFFISRGSEIKGTSESIGSGAQRVFRPNLSV